VLPASHTANDIEVNNVRPRHLSKREDLCVAHELSEIDVNANQPHSSTPNIHTSDCTECTPSMNDSGAIQRSGIGAEPVLR
jgi:hypothetical protein